MFLPLLPLPFQSLVGGKLEVLMKFGSVEHPELVDFTLPPDHPYTCNLLSRSSGKGLQGVYVGCAKWNRSDLKGFYPRGTKDDLAYYARQFNAIEFNATFYNSYQPDRIALWRDKTPEGFMFFPKVHRYISHVKWLIDVERSLDEFTHSIRFFEEKMGMAFLQLHNNFAPKNMDRLQRVLEIWPVDIPLAVELRHTDWFNDEVVAEELYSLLETYRATHIIVDTAGRRDLMHMRLTAPTAFVRFVGANHASDHDRLDAWVARIKTWEQQGLEHLYFFIHQHMEKESPLLIYQFIESFNRVFDRQLKGPGQQVLEF